MIRVKVAKSKRGRERSQKKTSTSTSKIEKFRHSPRVRPSGIGTTIGKKSVRIEPRLPSAESKISPRQEIRHANEVGRDVTFEIASAFRLRARKGIDGYVDLENLANIWQRFPAVIVCGGKKRVN